MTEEPPRSIHPAPAWVTRLLFAFVMLSLAALIVIPWYANRLSLPRRRELSDADDLGRSLVTKIHLHMAQEGSAVDDYVDDRSEATMRRFREADSSKEEAYQQLEPLVSTLGEVRRRRVAELLELE